MSKLGVHISAGNRRGFGDFLKQCALAGSPVAAVLSVDQDIYPDISQLSPLTTLVFRCKVDNDDNPPTLYQYKTSPEIEARNWYVQCKAKWELNHAPAIGYLSSATRTKRLCITIRLRQMKAAHTSHVVMRNS